MSLNRHAKKRDLNEAQIIATWIRMGCYVEALSGKGSPDTLVHFDGTLWRCEVKGAKRGLTPAQVESFTAAHNHGVPTYVVRSAADAAMLLETTLEPWTPKDGALAGAARKARPFTPGIAKARAVTEMCLVDWCATSRARGSTRCLRHALPTVTVDAGSPLHVVRGPGAGQLRAPQPSGRRRRTP